MGETLKPQESTHLRAGTRSNYEAVGRTIDQGIVVTRELLDLSVTRRLMGQDSTKIDDAIFSLALSLGDATLRVLKSINSRT
jgi:hypothetical protein